MIVGSMSEAFFISMSNFIYQLLCRVLFRCLGRLCFPSL